MTSRRAPARAARGRRRRRAARRRPPRPRGRSRRGRSARARARGGLAEAAAQLRVVDEEAERGGDPLRARVVEQESRLSREEDAGAVARARTRRPACRTSRPRAPAARARRPGSGTSRCRAPSRSRPSAAVNGRNEKSRSSPFAATSSLIADSSSVSRFVAASARPRSVRKYSGGRTPPPMITKCAGISSATRISRRLDELRPALLAADEAGEPDRDAILRQAERLAAVAAVSRDGQRDRVVDDRDGQVDREARRHVAVDRDRRVAPALHERGDRAAAAVASLARERRAEVPDDLRAVAVRDPRGRQQRRVVQVHEREVVRPHQALELVQVRRQRRHLAPEHQPAQPLVRRVPGVREDRDVAGVDRRADRRRRARPPGPPGRRRAARSADRGSRSAARATRARRRAAGGGGRRGSGSASARARGGGRSPRSAVRSATGRSSSRRASARPRRARARRCRVAQQLGHGRRPASSTPKSSTSTPVSPGTTTPPPVREPEATTGTPLAAASITGRPSSGPRDGATTTSQARYRSAVSCVKGTKRTTSERSSSSTSCFASDS